MGCDEKLELISRYIDDELSPEERSEFEEHLKHCEECRRALGEIRGTDGLVGKAVRAHRVGEGFVRRVMGRLTKPRGRWLALGGALAVAVLCAGLWWLLRAPEETERAGVVLRAVEGSLVEGRAAFEGMEVPAGAAARTAEGGLAIALGQATLYLGGGTEVRLDSSSQAALLSGEVFADARGTLRLKIRPALTARTEAARFGANAEGVTVVAGKVRAPFAGLDLWVPHGKRMRLGADEFWMDDVDLRAFRPAYVPDELFASPWPTEGGDERRSGFSPFPLSRPVEKRAPHEFAGPLGPPVVTAAGQLAAARGDELCLPGATAVKLPGEAVGSPCLFEGGAAVSAAGQGVAIISGGLLERTFACDAVAGCLVSRETVFVPVKGGLAAFKPDGDLLWAQELGATEFPVSKWRGVVFAACGDGYLRALDAATGEIVANSIVRPAGFAGYPVVAPGGRCYAVSGSQLVWLEREGRTGVIDMPEGSYPVPPAVHPSGAVYVCDGGGGLWKVTEEKPERVFDARSSATVQPVCDAEGNVLIPAGNELVCASAEGRELWRLDVGARVRGLAVGPNGLALAAGASLVLFEPTP